MPLGEALRETTIPFRDKLDSVERGCVTTVGAGFSLVRFYEGFRVNTTDKQTHIAVEKM